MSVTIRYIEEADLESLMEGERASNSIRMSDPEFGELSLLNPWALTADDVLKVLRQRACEQAGTYDTRAWVAEVKLEATEPDGEARKVPWVCGGFAYEVQENLFEVLFVSIHPAAPLPEIFGAMLAHLKRRAERSEKRKQVVLYLRDRDEAGLRTLLPLVVAEGFAVKLAPDHFGDHDGWRCVWRAPDEDEDDL
jgi:hypothetical protein